MKIRRIVSSAERVRTDLLVCGLFSSRSRSPLYGQLRSVLGRELDTILEAERFRFRPGDTAVIHGFGKIGARQLMLGVLDRRGRVRADDLRELAGKAARRARRGGLRRIALAVDPAFDSAGAGLDGKGAQALMEGVRLGGYRFESYRGEDDRQPDALIEVGLVVPDRRRSREFARGLERGVDTATATARARDLVNEPPNVATPPYMLNVAREIADEHGLELTVLEEPALRERGMGCLLAVGQGSSHPTYLAHLVYRPEVKPNARVALVGKCVTFDSGGLCLKPAAGMKTMKSDMGGAAAVLGALEGAARLKLPVELHAVIVPTENMTGPSAYRVGDVLRASNGKTVEVINTDAEGRLTLADALVYASELEPDVLIDLATLTGAVVAALGQRYTGVFSPSDRLARQLSRAGEYSGDRMWRLPLADEYKSELKSTVADLKNVGGRWGGAINAALFLQEFVARPRAWAHLDIAGPAFTERATAYQPKGGTGAPVRALLEFLETL